jgi:hypothetical protein
MSADARLPALTLAIALFALGCGDRTSLLDGIVTTDTRSVADAGQTVDAGPEPERLVVGFFGACVLRANATVGCFLFPGAGSDGSMEGDGSPLKVSLHTIAGVEGATQIAGHDPFCALLSDETVTCWTLSTGGGDGAFFDAIPVVGLDHATRIDMADTFGCAVRDDGSVWCWGTNDYNNLGLGHSACPEGGDCDTSIHPPGAVADVTGAVDVTVSPVNACARTETGGVYCWGRVGLDDTPNVTNDRFVPIQVPAASGALSIAMSEGSTTATLPSTFVVFGHPLGGEAPDAPTPVSQARAPGEQVFGNAYDTFCRKSEAALLHCMGGMSVDDDSETPTDFNVPETEALTDFVLGTATGCARISASELLCWGQYFNALTHVHIK